MRDHRRSSDRVTIDQVEMLHDGWSKLRQYRIRPGPTRIARLARHQA